MGIIINLHKVSDPLWFENIIFFLKKKYHYISLPELISCLKSGTLYKDICHITIDDGDRSFYTDIFPILRSHNIPSSIYVSANAVVNQENFWFQEISGLENLNLLRIISMVTEKDINNLKKYPVLDILKCLKIDLIWEIIARFQKEYKLDKTPCQNMNINELKEVENSGLVTIGAHTLKHPILANEETEVARREIELSFTSLADILGHEIKYFAYPNGIPGLDFGPREIEILKDCGCECSFSTESGNFSLRSSLFSIPRYGLSTGDKVSYLQLKLLFGAQWNNVMKCKPGNESINRKDLIKIMGGKFKKDIPI